MGVVCDVIFSLIAGLPEVYPNFVSVSDGVLQQYEKKFSGGFHAHGDPPQGQDYTYFPRYIFPCSVARKIIHINFATYLIKKKP